MKHHTPQLPPHLNGARDAVISAHLSGAAIPASVRLIQEWLEGDGWDEFIGAESNESVLVSIPTDQFNDATLRATLGISRSDSVTNPMRMQYGRECITEVLEEVGERDYPLAHCFELVSVSGKHAFIGGIVESQGVGYAITRWCGVFSTCRDFHNSLKVDGLWTTELLEQISDAELLEYWKH